MTMERALNISERKRTVLSVIAIGLVGTASGLFLGGAIIPFKSPEPDYLETTADAGRMLNVVHAHEGATLHDHLVTTVVTVKESSPHGYAHNFLAALTAGLFDSPTSLIQGQAPNEVVVFAREFHPLTLTVAAGTKVTWKNKDPEEHTATAENGLFDGYLPGGGGEFTFTFNEPGTYKYYCDPHPIMTATVIVK